MVSDKPAFVGSETHRALNEKLASGAILVAHNITFDKFIMRCAARRFNLLDDSGDEHWKQFPTFCTMRAMENICKLPGKIAGKYKWPKLSEAYEYAFAKPLVGAHDALADVRACAELYFWLQRKGLAAAGFKQERKVVAA
jgi:DNA polymerase III epsilon subunit-like protein